MQKKDSGLYIYCDIKMAQQGLFGKRPAEGPEQGDELMETARRTRTLEARYSTLERRNQVVEENMIEHHRKISSEIRLINEDLSEIKKQIEQLNDRISAITAELSQSARKEEMLTLKKYVDYWQPLNFVTQNKVGR